MLTAVFGGPIAIIFAVLHLGRVGGQRVEVSGGYFTLESTYVEAAINISLR